MNNSTLQQHIKQSIKVCSPRINFIAAVFKISVYIYGLFPHELRLWSCWYSPLPFPFHVVWVAVNPYTFVDLSSQGLFKISTCRDWPLNTSAPVGGSSREGDAAPSKDAGNEDSSMDASNSQLGSPHKKKSTVSSLFLL